MEDNDGIFDDILNFEEPSDPKDTQPDIVKEDDFFSSVPSTEPKENNPVLSELLKARGIENGKILIADDDNNTQEVDFHTLPVEEQLTILNPEPEVNNYDLDDSEIELLNQLRGMNQSPEEFLANYRQSIIDELDVAQTKDYDIDAYDDSELYILDLKNRIDLSDEELAKELNKELQDEPLFKKKVEALRNEYKQLEDQYRQTQQDEAERQTQEQYDQFSETMVNTAIATPEFYGIELEDDEKNEVLSFLLDVDDTGISQFSKTLNDPTKLYEAAWFLRYGKESFEALKNAYESEISKLKKQDNTRVIHKDTSGGASVKSIYDLTI